ncbi:hypothetical protein TUM12370_32510 [Salmonella enterica subsp. enterica serovar Choleraesuis]|nr:hypothetical protein TUM12370_32510 [Salmonella enterica subsp. enterica serovar Choleraesuis]
MGGERSAQHRDEQGAAGIVKGLSAQPLYPFTYGVQVIFCETNVNGTCVGYLEILSQADINM